MYRIRLEFPTHKQYSTSALVQDAHTHSACTQLLLRNIHTVQLDECTILFESARDQSYAVLALSGSSSYTVRVLDDKS